MLETFLWQKTLGKSLDQHDDCKEKLRQSLFSFRDKVGQLIATIPRDMEGLTIHDLTHLDALWQMADILTAGKYDLNPAEAFVFGGAVLLHDSGMTIPAYAGGLNEIKSSEIYMDALVQLQNRNKKSQPSKRVDESIIEKMAIFEALRVNHAIKAEELATQAWQIGIDKNVYLIDDQDLREHFGKTIGEIAHSHHWDISEIPRKLSVALGAHTKFPPDWIVNKIKIALLLRCCDAMHIDDRRAPSFMLASGSFSSLSLEHWNFQNKLAQPHIDDSKLVYTSKSHFEVIDSNAWHLCFDTILMIDKELRNAEDIHLQTGIELFSAKGVAGASSPDSLARYIQVEGWTPLPLNLKVSNVSSLAKTLGGKDLYSFPLAPLRELIQNAADAIEARVGLDPDFNIGDGLITVKISEEKEITTLVVEDNGIGMSERTLTSALLDFGFSYWRSNQARRDFPGLQKVASNLRGRYGIGFFSVFMWSSRVSVSSRIFNDAIVNTKILDFDSGLESRPILRPAREDEKSSKWNSRVKLIFDSNILANNKSEEGRDLFRLMENRFIPNDWKKRLTLICGALPITVILDKDGVKKQVSLPNWADCPENEIFDHFTGVLFTDEEYNNRFKATFSNMHSANHKGRCFLNPYKQDKNIQVSNKIGIYDKGIFVRYDINRNISGIIESETTNAARDKIKNLPFFDDLKWLQEVRSKAFGLSMHMGEELSIQKICIDFGFPDKTKNLYIYNRSFINHIKLLDEIQTAGCFEINLKETQQDEFEFKAVDSLKVFTGLSVDPFRVYCLVDFPGKIKKDDDVPSLIKNNKEWLFVLLREVIELLGETAEVFLKHSEHDGYRDDVFSITIKRKIELF